MTDNTALTIKDLFTKRDSAYARATKRILNTIPHMLEGIAEFSEMAKEYADKRLIWSEASIVLEEEVEFVLLIGLLAYQVGDVVSIGGQPYQVTEETAGRFQRIIRVGVPVELAMKDNKAAVLAYLQQQADQEEHDAQQLDDHFAQKQMADHTGFDLEELTDEQKAALMLHMRGVGHA